MTTSSLGSVQKFVAWVQSLLGPINLLPSWANEGLAATTFIPTLYFLFDIWGFVVFEVVSAIYEWWRWPRIDPNGFNPADVGQRSTAAVLALLALVGLQLLGVHRGWFPLIGFAILLGASLFARHEYRTR